MAVSFLKEMPYSLFHILCGYRVRGFRFYVNRQNGAKTVYQPGLAGCLIKYFFYCIFSKGLVGFLCILAIKVTDIP